MSSFGSFATTALDGMGRLATLRDIAPTDEELATVKLNAADFLGRLSVWADNIGALQPASSTKSLDYRLRDAPEIRHTIYMALGRVCEAAETALKIIRGESPYGFDDATLESEEGLNAEYLEATATDELAQLSLSIKTCINTLFRLSMLVRRHRPKGRLPKSDAGDDQLAPDIDPIDRSHVRDLFPHIKDKPWLVDRLAAAISKRRGYIRYREKHRKSLARVEDPALVGNEDGPEGTGTIATTFVEQDGSGNQSRADVESTFTSATSFASHFDSDQIDQETVVPDLQEMRMYGQQLSYDEPFECPLCRTIQIVADRQDWKAHVFSDLEPYVCTFPGCSLSSSLFSSRHQWWRHEVDHHRRTWHCAICANESTRSTSCLIDFKSKKSIEKHLRENHLGVITEAQVGFILKACQDPVPMGSFICPLCPEQLEGTDGKSLAKHLARHMQRLSLASIPIYLEGLEMRATKEIKPLGTVSDLEKRWNEWLRKNPRRRREERVKDQQASSKVVATGGPVENEGASSSKQRDGSP